MFFLNRYSLKKEIFVGLAESLSYVFLGIINAYVLSQDDDPQMFLWFFISLSLCSFSAILVTSMVSDEHRDEKTLGIQAANNPSGIAKQGMADNFCLSVRNIKW